MFVYAQELRTDCIPHELPQFPALDAEELHEPLAGMLRIEHQHVTIALEAVHA